jgi:formylglycine-generating enzyme required for sulfatase activity
MGQLLRAQSHRCGALGAEVRTNTEEKAADGGADAWSRKPEKPDEWLGDAKTCWLLKAGKAGSPLALKGEIGKSLPSDTLTKGGRFVLVASGSTSGKKGETDRLQTLTKEAEAAGLPTDRIAVIGSERLTEWVNQHPAIAARWANRPEGLWSLQDWPAQEHQAPWQASDPLALALATYRQVLDPTIVRPNESCLHLHLHGPPGAGKTRLALELCREAPWADFVVYVQQARDNNVLSLIAQAASEEGVRFVVMADDTQDDLLMPLRDALEGSEGRIRLITLGTSRSPDPRRITELAVEPLSIDSLSELVRWWYPAMPAELVRTAVDLAAGNPRLARLAADALAQNPGLSTTTLIEQPAIRELRAAIASHQKPKGRSDWTWPKAWDFTTYRSEKQQGFVGRQWLFEEVRAWATNPDSEQALLIGADYGVGKSAFLAELLDTGAAGLPVVAHHFCRADISDTLEAGRFVRSLAGQLADALPAYRALLEADDAKELRDKLDHADQKPLPAFDQAVLAPLRRIEAPATQVLLVIDALDEALDYRPEAGGSSRYTILDLLAKEARNLPPWLRVLATSRRRDEVLKPLRQGFFSIEEINAEDAENLADIHSYVKARCQQEPLAAILNRAGLSASETADLLQAKSGGKFLYAVRMLNDLASGALTLENRQSLDALSLGMDDFYADTFQRRFPEAGDYDVVKPLLALLCAQREPMGYGQLAAILEVSIDQIGRWIEPLQDLLRFQATPPSERSSDNAEEWRISFEHSSLQKWLTERSGGASRRPRAVRFGVDREVAAEQIRTWALAELEAGRAHTSPYLVRHLGNHLRDDERGEVIAGQLRQFPWLLARLREAGIEQLIEDFAIATFSPELVLLERLLKELSQVLRPEDGDAEDATLEQLAIQLSAQLPEEGSLGILRAQAEEWLASRRAVPEESRDDSISGGDNLQPTFQAGSPVNAMVCLPDGRLVSSDIASIRLWDVASGTSSAVLDGHEGWVRALVVLNNGQLVSGSDDRTIRLWDLASGSCSAVLEGHHGGVRDLAVLGDWCVASCSDDNTIRIWDLVSGTCSAVLEGHQSAVYALAVLVDGRIASGSDDRSIRLWDPVSGTCIAVIQGHQGGVRALAVLADGRLASGSEDRTIRLWDMETGTCSSRLEGHQGRVRALMVLADNRLASGSDDATIRIWDTSSGACSAVFEGHEREVNALAVLGDGRLTSGSDDRTIRLWDPTSSTVNGDSEEGSSGSPSLQRPGFVSTWPEEIELQPISFTTSTLTRERKTGFRAIGRPYGGWMRQDRQGEAWAFLDPNGPRGLTMVRIPAGSFRMGSPIDEAERHESEGPVHEVTLQEFLMSQTPITQGQWREVAEWQEKEGERWGRDLKPNPSWFCDAFDSEQRPVELVCWHDAREFCNRLSRRTKRIYTLPSEAQWEYSCRASKITTFAFGDTITPELANYAGGDSYANGPQGEHRKQTTPVGLFPANAWGLQDMHGNVREWCLDDWHRSYEGAPEDENAWLAESEGYINKGAVERKLLRGGSWHVSSMYCRSAYRSHDNPVNAHFDVGFRVVCLPQGRLS